MSDRRNALSSTVKTGSSLPNVPTSVTDPTLRTFLTQVKEFVEVGDNAGRGSKLDQIVRIKDLVDGQLVSLESSGGITPSIPSSGVESDLTPPPMPSGISITSGFGTLFVQFNGGVVPTFSQGRGYGGARIYAATYAGTGPLPLVGDATLIGTTSAAIYADAIPVLGTQRHYWVSYTTRDGIEGPKNAEINGFSGASARVGNVDLGPLIVESQNLSNGVQVGGQNLAPNNSFELDSNGDGLSDNWGGYNNAGGVEPITTSRVAGRQGGFAQRVSWSVNNTSTKGLLTGADFFAGGGVNGGWSPNSKNILSFYAKASGTNIGKPMGLAWNVPPASVDTLQSPVLTADWQRYVFRLNWGASVEPNGRAFLTIQVSSGSNGSLDFDDVQIQQGATPTEFFGKLAVNTIVAGDGAIANLAITNALIANAAVDNAKIANLDAVKITSGFIDSARVAVGSLDARIAAISDAQITNLNGNKIIANTIQVSRLTTNVYSGPSTMVKNSDFTEIKAGANALNNLVGWTYVNSGVLAPQGGRNYAGGSVWNIGKGGVWFYDPTPNPTAQQYIYQEVPVQPSTRHEFHIRVSVHRCVGSIYVSWLNSSLTDLGGALGYSIDPGAGVSGGSTGPGSMSLLWVTGVAPAGAALARVHLVKNGTNAGQSDSYLFAHNVMMCASDNLDLNNQTPYRPPATRVEIEGGALTANSVTADRMSVNQLSAITANIGLLRTSATGERTEIENNQIRVYDASNVLRVKIGQL